MTNNYCVQRCKFDFTIHEYVSQCVERWDLTQEQAKDLANVLNRHCTSSHYLYKSAKQHSTNAYLLSEYDVLWLNRILEMADNL